MIQKRGAIPHVAGNQEQFEQSLQVGQTLPPRLGRLIELNARQTGPKIVTLQLPVLFNHTHHLQIALFVGHTIEPAQGVNNGQVHFGRAGVARPPIGIQIGLADEITRLAAGLECGGVTRLFVPHEQREHHVIVSPEIPILEQTLLAREGAEIAVLGLAGDHFLDDRFGGRKELRIAIESNGLDR